MKKKTIEKVLSSKFDSFTKSIKDESVRKLVEKNTIITGGCIASMLLGEKVNDYDLYFRDFETVKAVANYYIKEFSNNKQKKGKAVKEMMVRTDKGRVYLVIKSSGVESETTDNKQYM